MQPAPMVVRVSRVVSVGRRSSPVQVVRREPNRQDILAIMNKIVRATVLAPAENSYLIDYINLANAKLQGGEAVLVGFWDKLTSVIDRELSLDGGHRLSDGYVRQVEERLRQLVALERGLACPSRSGLADQSQLLGPSPGECMHKLKLEELQVKYKAKKLESLLRSLQLTGRPVGEGKGSGRSKPGQLDSERTLGPSSRRDISRSANTKKSPLSSQPNSSRTIERTSAPSFSKVDAFVRTSTKVDVNRVAELCDLLKPGSSGKGGIDLSGSKRSVTSQAEQPRSLRQADLPIKITSRQTIQLPQRSSHHGQNANPSLALQQLSTQLDVQLEAARLLARDVKAQVQTHGNLVTTTATSTDDLEATLSGQLCDKAVFIYKQALEVRLRIERALTSSLAGLGPDSSLQTANSKDQRGRTAGDNSAQPLLSAIKTQLGIAQSEPPESILPALTRLFNSAEAFRTLKAQTPSLFIPEAKERELIDLHKVKQLSQLNDLIEQDLQRNRSQSSLSLKSPNTVDYFADLIERQRTIAQMFAKSATVNIYELPRETLEAQCSTLGEELLQVSDVRRVLDECGRASAEGPLPARLAETLGSLNQDAKELKLRLHNAEDENLVIMNRFLAYQEELYSLKQAVAPGSQHKEPAGPEALGVEVVEGEAKVEPVPANELESRFKALEEELQLRIRNQRKEIQKLEAKVGRLTPVFALLRVSPQEGDLAEKVRLRLFELGVGLDKLAEQPPRSSNKLVQSELTDFGSKLVSDGDRADSMSLYSAEKPSFFKSQLVQPGGELTLPVPPTGTSNSFKVSPGKGFDADQRGTPGSPTPALSTKLVSKPKP